MSKICKQLPLNLSNSEASGREDFLSSQCNEAVLAWLDSWPRWPGGGLVIYGPSGCGKTHLARIFNSMSGARYLKSHELSENTKVYEGTAHVIVEDMDPDVDEAAFLFLFNSTLERGGSIMITASQAPGNWGLKLPDLQSRIKTLVAVEFGLPDDELIAAVLVKLLTDRQLRVGTEVIHYLVPRVERSFQSLSSVVEELDKGSLAARRGITIPLVREILRNFNNYKGG